MTSDVPFDPQILARLLGNDAWKLTPATLASHISKGEWVPARHLTYISKKIAHKIAKGGARLIISLPPRFGKSELGSVWTPPWILENNPAKEIILCAYGADLATDFGRKVRDILMDDHNELSVQIRKDSTQVARFLTTEGGGVRSVGIKGPIYGRGADTFIVDDYYKNPEEAFSETTRQAIYDWFISIAMSRLHPGGNVIIIATRWLPDDLSGTLLSMPDSPWEEIKLPALAYGEEDFPYEGYVDPLGREPGVPLWPERYDLEHMLQVKKLVGSFFWSSIYQQKPLRSRHNIFKENWVQYTTRDKLPHGRHLRFIRTWDFAATPGGGDWTVGTLMARDLRNKNLYIIDMKRRQLSAAGVEELVRRTAENDGIGCEIVIEQEPGSSGKALIENYQLTVLPGYKVTGIRPTGDKFVRAQSYFAACEDKDVFLVRGSWNEKYIAEHLEFPTDGNKGHDDIVDSCSQGFNHMFQKKSKAGAWGRTGSGLWVPRGREDTATAEHVIAATSSHNGSNFVQGVTWGR